MKYMPGSHNKLFALYGELVDFIRKDVQSHKLELDPNNPRDYIDVFIIEMEKVREQAACTQWWKNLKYQYCNIL